MGTLKPANFDVIQLLYRNCCYSEAALYCHGSVGTTEFVLYGEVKCTVSFLEDILRDVPLYTYNYVVYIE